jgi:hypothetical protein
MLFDGADPALQMLDSLVELAIRKLDKCARFSELFV